MMETVHYMYMLFNQLETSLIDPLICFCTLMVPPFQIITIIKYDIVESTRMSRWSSGPSPSNVIVD